MTSLIAKLGLDGSGFARGLQTAKGQASKFQSSIAGNFRSGIATFFGFSAVRGILRTVIETSKEVGNIASKYGLTNEKASALYEVSKRTGDAVGELAEKLKDGDSYTQNMVDSAKALGAVWSENVNKSINESTLSFGTTWGQVKSGIAAYASGFIKDAALLVDSARFANQYLMALPMKMIADMAQGFKGENFTELIKSLYEVQLDEGVAEANLSAAGQPIKDFGKPKNPKKPITLNIPKLSDTTTDSVAKIGGFTSRAGVTASLGETLSRIEVNTKQTADNTATLQ